MWCLSCRGEFRDGVVTCPDCGTPLGSEAPPPDPDEPLEAVFQSADASLLPVLKSVLRGAGIPFVVQGDEAQSLYPLGAFGGGTEHRLLSALILVPRSSVEAAKAVLSTFDEAPPQGSAEEE